MTSNTDFEDEIEEIVYSAQEIAQAIEGLALRIGQDYAGQPLVLLGVLKGALCLTADLTRALIRIPPAPFLDHGRLHRGLELRQCSTLQRADSP